VSLALPSSPHSDVPLLMTTRTFWRARQAEGWLHVSSLPDPEDVLEEDAPADDPDWWPLSQLELLAYDLTERRFPGTMPYDALWTGDHQGVLCYPRWALEAAWDRLVARQQVLQYRA
jgi:hypothetical protein